MTVLGTVDMEVRIRSNHDCRTGRSLFVDVGSAGRRALETPEVRGVLISSSIDTSL